MNAPFGLATKLLLRLLLPGALLAAALGPITFQLRAAFSLEIDGLALFGISALALGWVLLLLDMPIYMLFEGRRYWPRWLRAIGIASERRRLARYIRNAEAAKTAGDEATRLEYRVRASQFPVSPSGGFEAWYPTRLGNLLAGSEQYPTIKYGLDGVFYWYRIWVSLDKDLREDIDNAQALVDGALYAVVSFVFCALMSVIYGVGSAWGLRIGLPVGATPALLYAISALSLVLATVIYRSCLHAQAQYGELFKSVFDQHRSKLDLKILLEDLEEHHPALTMRGKSERERNRAAWRFLRWHRYRPDQSDTNQIVENW